MSQVLHFKSQVSKGFTLVELIFVFTMLSFLFGLGAIALGNFTSSQGLRFAGDKLAQSLREAHTNAVAQYQDSAWGIYLDTAPTPEQYVLFKGNTYASRDTAFDQPNEFYKTVEFQNISLAGGGQEIVFSKRSGFTSDNGTFRLAADGEFYNISVNSLGLVDFSF